MYSGTLIKVISHLTTVEAECGSLNGAERSFKPDLRLSTLKPIHAKWVMDALHDVSKRNDMVTKGWKLAMSVTEPTATTLDDYNTEEEVETEESTGAEGHHPEASPSREQNDEPT